MIRDAQIADKARVVELLRDSRKGAGFDDPAGLTGFSFAFDREYAERLFLAHLRGSTCCILYDVDGVAHGVLMAIAYEHPFGPVWLARETVWFIDPAHRGGTTALRMLDAYEGWARSRGCQFIGMAGMGYDPDVAALYQRRGYRVAETHYLKAI